MKKIFLCIFFLNAILNLKSQTCTSGLNGTYKVGPTGSYPTLTAALNTLRISGLNGPVVLELQATYTSSNETFPINFSGINCLSSSRRLLIQPEVTASNLLITSSNTVTTLLFDNARYISIDGRPGGQGITSQLKLTSLSTTATVVRFQNDASFNTLNYLTVQSANNSQLGLVFFGTSNQSITNGNSYNEISNCILTYDTFKPSYTSIYSLGTDNKKNRENIIKNCEIAYFVEAGISLQKNSDAWRIEGNSFYGSAGTKASIYIFDTTSSNFQIIGNFIGGTRSNCAGSAMQVTDRFIGMQLYTGSSGYTSVQANTIANISEIATQYNFFAGVFLGAGKFMVGTGQGNTIGSLTENNSIRFGMNSINANSFAMFGIIAENSFSNIIAGIDTTYIQNNTISGLNAYQYGLGYTGGTLTAIEIRDQTRGYVAISNNKIGNPVQYNSIANTSHAGGNLTVGISIKNSQDRNGQYIKNLVKNNIIANLSGDCYGINIADGSADVIGNTIKNLYASYFSTDNGSVRGIYFSNCPNGQLISGNTIHTLYSKTQSPYVSGIELTYTSFSTIEKNNIHSLQATSTFNSCVFKGIETNYSKSLQIQNNIIRLGIDTAGKASNGDYSIYGIAVAADSSTIKNNSIYIGGTGDGETAAIYCNSTTKAITNNILFNARTGTTSGSAYYSHYAFRYIGSSIRKLGLNNNIYYTTGIRSYLGSVYNNYTNYYANTISEWRSLSRSDSNSMFYNPNFANPTGNVNTGDLHLASPNPAEGQGSFETTVSDDFDGDQRSSFSPTDIGADAGNFTLQDGDTPLLTHPSFVGQLISARETYNVQITDNGGGIDTGANTPRMWYRQKYPLTSNWVSIAGVLRSGTPHSGFWEFTPDLSLIGTTLNAGDSLEYYFIAQDKGPIINVGYSNIAGAAHVNVNTQVHAPTTPLRLLIIGSFPDTVYVGSGQTYTSLTNSGGFFEASNKMAFPPNNLSPIINITTDLLAETGAYRYTNLSPTRNTVHIQTSTTVVKKVQNIGNLTQPLITLQDVHNLVIDGTVNGSGRYLLFRNGNTAPAYGYGVASLINPDSITLKSCIFESNMNQSYGAVIYAYSSEAKGLQIINNLVRNIESGSMAGLPLTSLHLNIANGDSVIISKNEFANFGRTGLSITQPVLNPSIRYRIDSNHFYHNSAIVSIGSRTAIYQSTYLPTLITNNFIGGSAPFCGGSPWRFTTQVSGNVSFTGISLDVSKDTMSNIRNNVISNIHITNFGYNFFGIHSQGDEALNLEGNVIGDPSKDSSIVNKAVFYGIHCISGIYSTYSPEVLIKNNLVAGITAPSILGIYVEAAKAMIDGNKVTRLRTSGYATGIAGYTGMHISVRDGKLLNNEVSDLICTNAPGWAYGIKAYATGALPYELIIERNRVFDLHSNDESYTYISGLYIQNGQYKIRNNTISLTSGPAVSGIPIYGIYLSTNASDVFQNEVVYNTIYIGGLSNTMAKTAAVYIDGGSPVANFRNNLLYNERSGQGTHLALSVLPSSGASAWTNANIPNNNFYVTKDTSLVNEWTDKGIMGIQQWRGYVRGDSASFAKKSADIPAEDFFLNVAKGNMHINTNNGVSWYVNGKGTPLSNISGDMDAATGIRSTNISTGPTDIGADEFTTTTLPLGGVGEDCDYHVFSATLINGAVYQWQEDQGNGFANIADGDIYQGTKNATLYVYKVPYGWNGYKYRCIITTENTNTTTLGEPLQFLNLWTGVVSNEWSNPANWSCDKIPDENMDVIIRAGLLTYPYISTNATVRSFTVQPGASVAIAGGVTLKIIH